MVSRSKKVRTTAKRDRDWPPKPIDPSKLSEEEANVYWGRMTEREAADRVNRLRKDGYVQPPTKA